jgi:hypothetical protein
MKSFVTITDTRTLTIVGKCVCDQFNIETARRAFAKRNGDATGMYHIAFSCSVNDEYIMKLCNPDGYDLHQLEDAYNQATREK